MRVLRTLLTWFVGLGALVALMLYLAGVLTPGRVAPGEMPPAAHAVPAGLRTVTVAVRKIPVYYEAVGTVRSRRRSEIASQTAGRILSVAVREGDRVDQGQLLVRIEAAVVQARLEQARRALEAARAAEQAAADLVSAAAARQVQAAAEHQRIQQLLGEQAATPRQAEAAEAGYREAEAGLNAARARLAAARAEVSGAVGRVREAEVALQYTEVRAPEAGEVVERRVDPGDLAWSGRPLVVLQNPTDLRFEAALREGLIARAGVGVKVGVRIEALGLDLEAVVDEIAPSADPRSRTFLVKAALPPRPGLRTGMFGRLRLRLGERETVLVPPGALRRIGQLERVQVLEHGRLRTRLVRTGATHAGEVEVLSGLQGGETLALAEGR